MEETWRDIEGYKNLYQVSNLGRVKSFDRVDSIGRKKNGIVLSNNKTNGNGYKIVSLHNNGVKKNKYVHRLVAYAFIEGSNERVDHINNDKSDNRAENLQFLTHRENISKNPPWKGTSKYTGVCWAKERNKWVSAISINGKRKHLGYFNEDYTASITYQIALQNHLNQQTDEKIN